MTFWASIFHIFHVWEISINFCLIHCETPCRQQCHKGRGKHNFWHITLNLWVSNFHPHQFTIQAHQHKWYMRTIILEMSWGGEATRNNTRLIFQGCHFCDQLPPPICSWSKSFIPEKTASKQPRTSFTHLHSLELGKHVVHKNVVGGGSMVGCPLVIALSEWDIPGI